MKVCARESGEAMNQTSARSLDELVNMNVLHGNRKYLSKVGDRQGRKTARGEQVKHWPSRFGLSFPPFPAPPPHGRPASLAFAWPRPCCRFSTKGRLEPRCPGAMPSCGQKVAGCSSLESKSKPAIEMGDPEPCKELRRRPQLFLAGIVPYSPS